MFCDKDDWRWSEINLFYEKNLDSKENQNLADVKEYFCITMKNYIKGSDVVEIEKQTQPGHYLIRVGNDRYTMIEDGIYKCRTFQQISNALHHSRV